MKILFLIIILFSISLIGCKKDCETKSAPCNESVPNEDCKALFTRWFFNKEKNSCEKIIYSGCSAKGFASQSECEKCQCDK